MTEEKLSKKEAAAYLRVTPRSLQSYTAAGKLAAVYEHGKHGPEARYRRVDLDAFRRIIPARFLLRPNKPGVAPSPPAPELSPDSEGPPKPDETRFEFRLDRYWSAKAAERAEKEGMSRHNFARRCLVTVLEEVDTASVKQELRELREETSKLQQWHRRAVYRILLEIMNPKPLEEAEAKGEAKEFVSKLK